MSTVEPNEPDEGTPYVDHEDHLNREFIRVNGHSLDDGALVSVLTTGDVVLEAAAIHVLGSDFPNAATHELQARLVSDDDLIRVEAAFALARSGSVEGTAELVRCLQQPIDTGIAAPIAAGYLARLEDPSGYDVVAAGLVIEILAIRMIACKQLYFFEPFEGVVISSGTTVDLYQLFRTALDDADASVRMQSLVQLCWIDSDEARELLRYCMENAQSDGFRDLARRALHDDYGVTRRQEDDR